MIHMVWWVVVSLSFSGSLCIIFLFACFHFLKDRISRQWQYYIWLIVILRLLIPVSPQNSLIGSIFQRIDDRTYIMSMQMGGGFEETKAAESDLKNEKIGVPEVSQGSRDSAIAGRYPSNKVTETAKESVSKETGILFLRKYCGTIWFGVALMLLVQKIWYYQKYIKKIKVGQMPVTDDALIEIFEAVIKQEGVKQKVVLCVNPAVASPLLIGIFHPCIVLPDSMLSEVRFRYTVRHEITHWKRMDLFYKWLVQLTVCIHWFNPIIYAMRREVEKACEFSCDEAIIKKLDFIEIQNYGRTLLEAMPRAKNKKQPASIALTENKKVLKERLIAMMQYKKKTKRTVFATLVLVVLLMAGATVSGAYVMPTGRHSSVTDGGNIRYQDGIYYLFCDGAGEADRPMASVTNGMTGIVLVKKMDISLLALSQRRKDF